MLPSRLIWGAALVCALTHVSGPAWSLNVYEAWQAAQAQDPRIRAARATRDATQERLPQARSQLLPNLSANVSRNKNNVDLQSENVLGMTNHSHDIYFSYSQNVQLRQPLYRKPLRAGVRQAEFMVADANAILEYENQELAVRVTNAYMDALLAQDTYTLAEKRQAVTTTQLAAAQKAVVAGSGTRTDVDEVQARLDMAAAEVISARQQVELARRQLEILIGQSAQHLALVDIVNLPLLPLVPAELQDWVTQAEQHSPEIRALQARLDAARAEIDKARSAHYPTLDAVAMVGRSGSENINSPNSSNTQRMIGLQLNVPLYSGGHTQSTVRQAIAEEVRAQENLEATRRDLAVRVHREFRGVSEGMHKIRALQQAEKSGEQLVESSRRSWEAGFRTMLDVLSAEQQLQSVQRDLAEARYLYLAARVRLHALTGGDMEAVMREMSGWMVEVEATQE